MFRRFSARRYGQALCFVILISTLPIFFLFSKQKTVPYFVQEHPYFHYDLDLEEPRNLDQKCLIPRLHPFDPSIWNYLSSQRSIFCKSRTLDLIYIDTNGRLRYNDSGLQSSGYKVDKSLFCYWSPVQRGGVNADDDDSVVYGKQVLLEADGIQLPGDTDFIRVQCKNFAKITVYDKIHAYIRNISKPAEEPSSRNRINVLIFGIDSLSRLAFIRYLPKTYRYLTENLKMTVFRGMNKIGDNTYPNLVALLTGREVYGGNLPDESKGFDEWPLIWKNYSSAGYATMWAEDFAKFGLFNYLAKGFRRPPTLHYLRPFWLAVEESSLLKISSHMCYGSIPKHKLQMDYVRNFVSTYQKKMIPYFGFSFLAEISHEYFYRVTAADNQFEEFFKFLNDGNFLNDTVLIVMSDHGHRFDAIRTTQVGAIEERMPFFAIHVPKSISSLQPEIMANFAVNKGRLVTPFDTHATLADILNRAVTGQPLGQSPPPEGCLGQSLFAPVAADRTCSSASIPDHYCVCETESTIEVSDTRATAAAKATINRINEMLFSGEMKDNEGQCVRLTLGTIRSAYIVHKAEEKDPSTSLTKVRVVIEAEPSKGIFEATVLVGDVAVEVLGDVSRLNVYGQQSSCIKHIILRKYCFCSKYLYNSKTVTSKEKL